MSAATQQNLRKRVVHQLDTPFSTASWPEISLEDQDTILELLCNLLSPIGNHRRTHIQPSKGKRALKRKKGQLQLEPHAAEPPRPPMPDLAASIDVGFNLISRNLEANPSPSGEPVRAYSMVFVARGNQSPAFNCHFPQMIGAAAKKLSPDTKTRLVGLSKPCSERLSSCLGIARVSSLAITHDAPGVSALWSVVQESVPPIEMPWLENPVEPTFQETRIKSMETTIGVRKTKNDAQ